MIPVAVGTFVVFLILSFYYKSKVAFITSVIFFFGTLAFCFFYFEYTAPNYSNHKEIFEGNFFKEPVPLRVPNKDDDDAYNKIHQGMEWHVAIHQSPDREERSNYGQFSIWRIGNAIVSFENGIVTGKTRCLSR